MASDWVGLTEDEENALWESTVSDWELMKLTEKFLREKNAGKPAAADKAGGDEPVEFWNAVDGWVPVPAESGDKPAAWVYPEFWEHLEKVGCGTAYRTEGDGRHPLFTRPQPQAQAMRDALTVGIGITRIDPRDIYSDPKEKNSG